MKKIKKEITVDIKSRLLVWAAIKNKTKLLKFVIKMGADIDKKVYGYTPIESACIYQNNQIIKILVKSGCKLNYSGSIICHLLAEYDQYNILSGLVKKGLEVNMRDENGRTGLHWAAEKGNVRCTAILAESGADLNIKDRNGMAPLTIACINGNYEAAVILLKHNAEVNCRDSEGHTPLFHAKIKQRKMIQELLLANGADKQNCR